MIPISYLEVLKALRICVQKPRYRVGVFTITLKDAERNYYNVIDAIRMDDEENNAVESYRNTSIDRRVMFKNGSYIRFVRASENARGCKFNHVLYDENIDHKFLVTVVRMTESRYMEENNLG